MVGCDRGDDVNTLWVAMCFGELCVDSKTRPLEGQEGMGRIGVCIYGHHTEHVHRYWDWSVCPT